MTQQQRVREFSRTVLALAVLSAFASAQAQDKKEEEKSPIETQASVEVGATGVSGDPSDRAFWGQYNGMRNQDAFGILNFDYSRRDTSTGTWLDVYGSNLGLQTRELGVFWTRQGEWKLNANYGELWAVNPYTVNTGVTGAGTTTPKSNYLFNGPGSGGDYQPSTKRQSFELGGSKSLDSTWMLEGRINSENKNGSQLFGVGNQCANTASSGCNFVPGATAGFGVLYVPQPIDYNHTQAEARVNYAGSALQLSAGYYGSFFSNANGSMTPTAPSTLNNAVGRPLTAGTGVASYLSQTVALQPDNSFNSVDVTGVYTFSPAIRANFKLGYSRTTQDQDFAGMGLAGAPNGISSLNGEVNNTLAQLRVVANPIAKLSLVGEYRYSNTDDKTQVAAYNQVGTVQSTNQTVSREVNTAKLEATYRFPWAVQGSAGLGWNSIDRGTYTPTATYTGVSALRENTDETSWWLQVRRNMTETVSGLLSYTSSKRDGSNWLAPAAGGVGLVSVTDPAAQLGPNAIYMPTLADRDRSKLRLLLSWAATEALSLQFAADVGRDDYNAPTQFALQSSKFDLYTIDANYVLTDAWNLNGFISKGSQKLNTARPQGYILAFDDDSLNIGLGLNGKVSEKLTLGTTVSYISNVDKYAQSIGVNPAPGTAQLLAATGGLPDVVYRRLDLRVYGAYALGEKSTIRFDAGYQRLTYDDWGYAYNGTPFLYSDNTTVWMQPNQNVGYLGLSYVYSWK